MLCPAKALKESRDAVTFANFCCDLYMFHKRLSFVLRSLFSVKHYTALAAAYIAVGHRLVVVSTPSLFPIKPDVINSFFHRLNPTYSSNSAFIRYNADP